jgi:outer membrane protein
VSGARIARKSQIVMVSFAERRKKMRLRSLIQAGAMMALCGLGGAALRAQSKPANAGEPAAKVAAINMRVAIANTAEGKQAAAQLETEFLARRKELEDLNKKINDLQQRLTVGATTLSEEEKQNDAQSDVISRIGRRMVEVLGKYAPNNGYGAVLDDSSQSTPVMYASADITQEIVKLYDQTYPVKSADGAAGDGKPATKAVAKPSER